MARGCDHGAAHVDVVHRHATPAFAKVSWAFVDAYIDQTIARRGRWRHLSAAQRREIAATFWRVGRLTLEHWLVPRPAPDVVTSHPDAEVSHSSGRGRRRRRAHPLHRRVHHR